MNEIEEHRRKMRRNVRLWNTLVLLAGAVALAKICAGCGSVTAGCHLTAGLHNEVSCGADYIPRPEPTPFVPFALR